MLSIRKIGAFGRTYRHLNRYRQILAILFKYGFGDLIERLNIEQYIEIGLRMISNNKRQPHPVRRLTRPQRVRMALEELGTTYIKLGQILSTRSDLVPIRYIEELSKLQESVTPFSFMEVKKVIKSEFDKPVNLLFEEFYKKPLASASIGQVHKAVLKNGETVAVKVQRPNIKNIVEVDIEIMLHLAMLMERNIEEMAFFRPVKLIEEFSRGLEKELDYNREADNLERFSRQFFTDHTIYVPKVYREMTTERILTMEFIDGINISDTQAIDRARLSRKKIVNRGADLFLRQIFDHGYFHADPHPGNIRILSGNVLCFLDFGMMGIIDRYTKADFVDLIYSVVKQDEARATRTLLQLTSWEKEPDLRLLERDVSELMGNYFYKPLKDIEIGKLVQQMIELNSRYSLRIPPGIFLMMKTLSTIEDIARNLYPDFDMVTHLAPFIRREKTEKFHPKKIAESILDISGNFFDFFNKFPREALDVIRIIKRQRLQVHFEHHGLEKMIETHDRISNKISFAIIIAALIIGSSIVIIAKIPPLFFGISFIGIIVFVAAVILGGWLMIAILRKGKL